MTRYQCLKDKTHSFVHPAKKTEYMYGSMQQPDFVEKHMCPFCGSLEYAEYPEPQPEINSIKSVNIEEADDWLRKGYKVLDRYAKTVTIGQYSFVESKVILSKSEECRKQEEK